MIMMELQYRDVMIHTSLKARWSDSWTDGMEVNLMVRQTNEWSDGDTREQAGRHKDRWMDGQMDVS